MFDSETDKLILKVHADKNNLNIYQLEKQVKTYFILYIFPYVRHSEADVKNYHFESPLRSLNALKCKIQNIPSDF